MNLRRLNDELAVALTWLTRLPVRFPETPASAMGEVGAERSEGVEVSASQPFSDTDARAADPLPGPPPSQGEGDPAATPSKKQANPQHRQLGPPFTPPPAKGEVGAERSEGVETSASQPFNDTDAGAADPLPGPPRFSRFPRKSLSAEASQGEGVRTPTLAESSWAFPVVGAMLGGTTAFVIVLAEWLGAPALLASVLAVAALTLLTGALHEDGLADFFDGLGARGSEAKKLAAMRDSQIGTYGVLALIIAFAIRIAAIASLSHALWLVVICALSRAAMVHGMRALPFARQDGAAHAAGTPDDRQANLAIIIGAGLLVLAVIASGFVLGAGIGIALAGIAGTWWVLRRARLSFGGITGDVLGAICMISETAMLAMAAILLT